MSNVGEGGNVAAQAIAAALYHKAVRGEGQHVRLAMLDAVVAYLWPEGMAGYTKVGDEAATAGAETGPDLIFRTADGYIAAGTVSDAEWRGLCGALGRPEWIEDPRFRTGAARSANVIERVTLVGEILRHDSSAAWLAKLDAADVPCAPVLTRRALLDDPQVAANGLVVEYDQPGLGLVRQARPAARFARTPARIRCPAPGIGEHTRDILAELGDDAATIDLTISALAEEAKR